MENDVESISKEESSDGVYNKIRNMVWKTWFEKISLRMSDVEVYTAEK